EVCPGSEGNPQSHAVNGVKITERRVRVVRAEPKPTEALLEAGAEAHTLLVGRHRVAGTERERVHDRVFGANPQVLVKVSRTFGIDTDLERMGVRIQTRQVNQVHRDTDPEGQRQLEVLLDVLQLPREVTYVHGEDEAAETGPVQHAEVDGHGVHREVIHRVIAHRTRLDGLVQVLVRVAAVAANREAVGPRS